MTKYNYAERVVKKIRKRFEYIDIYKDILNVNPKISLNSDYELESIIFDNYNQIIVTDTKIIYKSYYYKTDTIILQFKSFDHFLKI